MYVLYMSKKLNKGNELGKENKKYSKWAKVFHHGINHFL